METIDKSTLLDTVTGGDEVLEPDLEYMKSLETENSVITAFCKKCGSYHGLAYKDAEEIFLILKEPLDFNNKYLLFSSCNICKVGEKIVELKTF